MMIQDDIALLEHRLTSTQPQLSSNLVGRMIDDINNILTNSNEMIETLANDCSISNQIKKLQVLKKDIIDRALITCHRMVKDLNTIITTEQSKFSLKNRFMESTSKWQKVVFDTIEMRRLHQIERANFILNHKLARSSRTNTISQIASIIPYEMETNKYQYS